jgi:Trk K+ transport system NAD-binding subunit
MINPHAETVLLSDGEMILIGSIESEERFFRRYRPRE